LALSVAVEIRCEPDTAIGDRTRGRLFRFGYCADRHSVNAYRQDWRHHLRHLFEPSADVPWRHIRFGQHFRRHGITDWGRQRRDGAFFGAAPFALLLAWPSIPPFTVGALGCAALLGAGNGAVFKLVPQYFPAETGTVTGLVGAMGGLGGFFPPLLLGILRDRLGAIWPGFVFCR